MAGGNRCAFGCVVVVGSMTDNICLPFLLFECITNTLFHRLASWCVDQQR